MIYICKTVTQEFLSHMNRLRFLPTADPTAAIFPAPTWADIDHWAVRVVSVSMNTTSGKISENYFQKLEALATRIVLNIPNSADCPMATAMNSLNFHNLWHYVVLHSSFWEWQDYLNNFLTEVAQQSLTSISEQYFPDSDFRAIFSPSV